MLIHIKANIRNPPDDAYGCAKAAAELAKFDFDHFSAMAQNGQGRITITVAGKPDPAGFHAVTIDFEDFSGGAETAFHPWRR